MKTDAIRNESFMKNEINQEIRFKRECLEVEKKQFFPEAFEKN
jgi:hypothetical protein